MSGRSILLWLTLALWPAMDAIALGLGDIRVESALNQPLSAEIEILGSSHDELQRLKIAVAGRDRFLQFGADRPGFLSSVSFRIVEDGAGHATLHVRSAEAFTEPFVALLIEVSWPSGQLIRDYTLLLDPPGVDPVTAPTTVVARPAAPGAHVQALPPDGAPVDTTGAPARAQHRNPPTHDAPDPDAVGQAANNRLAAPGVHHPRPRSTPASVAPASRAADASALAGLLERITALEKALEETKAVQAREHAELLALRAEVTERASSEPAPHPVEPVSVLHTPSPAAEPVIAEPAATQPAEEDTVTPETARQEPLETQGDDPAALPSTNVIGATAAARRIPWRLAMLLVAIAVLLHLTRRQRERRRATHAALSSFEDAEPVPDAAATHPDSRDGPATTDRDALWMHPPAVSVNDVPKPARAALAGDESVEPASAAPAGEPIADHLADETTAGYLTVLEKQVLAESPAEDGFLDDDATVEARPPAVDDHTEGIGTTLESSGISADFRILEPDLTSTDVELTTRRYDHAPGTTEHRSDATDSLKNALSMAIKREPDRVDLRVKLLEVYYATTVANRLAFHELASALSRERDHVPAEELERIFAMQRAITAGPGRAAPPAAGEDLADCA